MSETNNSSPITLDDMKKFLVAKGHPAFAVEDYLTDMYDYCEEVYPATLEELEADYQLAKEFYEG